MATIRAYTTIEQSKKLANILPLASADMFLAMDGIVPVMSKYIDDGLVTADETAIPCWSLAALFDVLDHGALFKTPQGWACQSYIDFKAITSDYHSNPIDACVAMIEKLSELNLL